PTSQSVAPDPAGRRRRGGQRGGRGPGRRPPRLASSFNSPKRRLCLLQPKAHVHLSVHRDGGGQVFPCLRSIACTPVERAEAEVAVGDERAHAELVGPREGPPVVLSGGLQI